MEVTYIRSVTWEISTEAMGLCIYYFAFIEAEKFHQIVLVLSKIDDPPYARNFLGVD